jgi:hypothetical protein
MDSLKKFIKSRQAKNILKDVLFMLLFIHSTIKVGIILSSLSFANIYLLGKRLTKVEKTIILNKKESLKETQFLNGCKSSSKYLTSIYC